MADVDEGRTARVRAAICPVHAEPRVSSGQASQALHGHALMVVERRDEWHRVRGADGYEGWVHRGYLVPDEPAWSSARVSLGCVANDAAGHRLALPLGALVHPRQQLAEGEALEPAIRAVRFPPRAPAIAATAVARFAGTSYQWGGVTPWGADCSGLVQQAFGLHGVVLPRDAWQQAALDSAGWTRVASIGDARVGDLLFFSDRDDGRITHVGLGLDGGRMVHLALGRGGYAVERLDDTGDAYVAKLLERFRHALRAPATLVAA